MPSLSDPPQDQEKQSSNGNNDNGNGNETPERLLEYQNKCLLRELDANQRVRHENIIAMHQIETFSDSSSSDLLSDKINDLHITSNQQQNIKTKVMPQILAQSHKHQQEPTTVSAFANKVQTRKQQSMKNVAVLMEFCENGELYDYIADHGKFSEDLAKTYFVQLLKAVHACHSKGVFHRDIKLENILLDNEFRLKLADFGLCSVMHQDTPDGYLSDSSGTLSYMAPEVVQGKSYHGAPADIWSAGVLLFIMLAGYPPFEAPLAQDQWFRALESGQLGRFWKLHADNANVPYHAMSLLNKIFVMDPKKRITLSEIFEHPWLKGYVPLDSATVKAIMGKRRNGSLQKQQLEAARKEAEKPAPQQPSKASVAAQQQQPVKVSAPAQVVPPKTTPAVPEKQIQQISALPQQSSNIVKTGAGARAQVTRQF